VVRHTDTGRFVRADLWGTIPASTYHLEAKHGDTLTLVRAMGYVDGDIPENWRLP